MEKYSKQKEYFQTAYNTGTDNWTQIDFKTKLLEYITYFPDEATILDIGCGRGLLSFLLTEIGYKVIGLDYIKKIVKVNNEEVKAKGLTGRVGFVEGDVFDMPLTDGSVNIVLDAGLLHHVHVEDWGTYTKEVDRVLKRGGLYMSIALSKATHRYLDFEPKNSDTQDFEKYGARYHFFRTGEIREIFGPKYELVKEEIFIARDKTDLIFTLLKKK
ncbi:MAG: ubiquinone/menaquinone biosynthesis C-methylase UbiE [Candidatus Paceibacteria bacterium]|jgi:ubiquinone/menaquinone biosynthesis C-methylase UbiE